MGIKCGIVGLPNVGKSTLFNALTAAQIPAENYPFCTIDPNIGVVAVPDPRLDALAEIVTPQKIVPTVVEFVDIAGLVAGASIPVMAGPALADKGGCRQAAKAKFPGDHKSRVAYRKECRAHYKAYRSAQKASKKAAG